ncbi:flavin reductase family protein [Kineococcus rhizosphaerae]|uniref:Flavin reductase (DIM6/NTAB) family NADH-FMN oxidoreductase RutF n=1 Tax=Kineococcus rhizosphaerae TaxID=559628 RepID=A0A2T0R1K1_9ACTN|nr:flavin reductase family protein [Kineococcus rhizosphaerae]PRY13401.1 flavin reductase (DIM6/NTAB) family NADH-FMN oxidoreductase RutF [Kineococcus rhizosphaerae]
MPQPTTAPPPTAPLVVEDAHDPRSYRTVLGHVPTGVTLVTSGPADAAAARPTAAMVVGTFGSVSLDPPLVAFMPDRASTTWPLLRAHGRFTASVLGHGQVDVCRAFARKEEDRFERFAWHRTGAGGHVVAGAAAWVDCEIHDVLAAGDHDIVLARVLALGANPDVAQSLVFSRGAYGAPTPL